MGWKSEGSTDRKGRNKGKQKGERKGKICPVY